MADLALALPTARRTTATAKVREWVPAVCTAAAAVLWIVTVRRTDFAAMRPLGLVTILGPSYFLGLAVISVGLAVELVRGRPREAWLCTLVVALVVYLFGTPCAVEPVAALTSAWVHAGFVRYVFLHGNVLNGFTAEFSWPGTFSMFALLVGFTGKTTAIPLLRWFPLGIELAYLPALVAIARASGVSKRVGWLGIAIFYGTDWIYQDYFSPQAVNFLMYLVVVAVVLTCWRPLATAAAGTAPALRARFGSLRDAVRPRRLLGYESVAVWSPGTVLATFFVVVLISLATAMSHQLTPYAIVLALVACLVTRRLGRPELPAIAFLLAVGWLSLGASNYWLGHLSQIFGNIFQIGSTLSGNVSSRVTGSASHRLVVDARILLTLALFGLAAVGAVRRATASRTLELLTVAPFLVLAGQSYGGEGLLRVALLSGPFASLLVASAVLPRRTGAIRPIVRPFRLGRHGRALLALAITVGLLGAATTMTVVRGGNDYYESFAAGELDAVNLTYLHVHAGQTVGLVAPYAPIGQWAVGSVRAYAVAGAGTVPTLRQMRRNLLHVRPSYVILSRAQGNWGEVLGGLPTGWQHQLALFLVANGYVVFGRTPTAVVLYTAHGF